MWVRISAAAAAVILAVLLGYVVSLTFAPGGIVVPTGGVTDGGPQDHLAAAGEAGGVLAQRTELQRWRSVSGPAPGEDPEGIEPTSPPAAATGPSAPGATVTGWLAELPHDWTLLRPPAFHEGTVNLPKPRSAVLEQPGGRDWRRLHMDTIPDAGGWIVFGIGLLLALFLLLRGRIPLELGFSGRTVLRFPPLERANHWMTAASFIVMALTGLIILYGQYLVKPWLGAAAFSGLAAGSLYLHVAFAVPFVLGVAVMAVLWLRQNLPERLDLRWLARFGGFVGSDPVKPPARRFNAGQKLIFWGVLGGGLVLFVSGLGLLFPFFWTGIEGMQWSLAVHSVVALLMVGLIIGHIYIGTVGMVGAFDAMWSGEVDRNWAAEHHQLWLAEIEGRPPQEIRDEVAGHRPDASPAPAE